MSLLSTRCQFYSFVIALTCLSHSVEAQLEKNYSPRQTHSKLSKDLIKGLEFQFEQEYWTMPDNRQIQEINHERKTIFIKKVVEGAFIKDDSLEKYVDNVLRQIVNNNAVQPHSRKALVLSSPHVNAVCYGRGIYAVTVGLLARIENEDQLAFILAHELAHDELGHLRTRILQEADLDLEGKATEQTFKVISGKIVKEEIEEFRKILYDYTRHSRNNEIKADSLALVLLRNAGYNERKSFATLDILRAAQAPKYPVGVELFMPFHAPDFPFQDHWLHSRPTVYSKKYVGTFLYADDSIKTHPEINIRKQLLAPHIRPVGDSTTYQISAFFSAVSELAAFETVESAYKNNAYDLSLYYALHLLHRYPDNVYLISRITGILNDLYDARNSNSFYQYVPRYTLNYGEELKLINNFLHNLSQKELGELSYRFIHSPTNFNPDERSHYYLLWQIGNLTNRAEVRRQAAKAYRERFRSSIDSYRYQ